MNDKNSTTPTPANKDKGRLCLKVGTPERFECAYTMLQRFQPTFEDFQTISSASAVLMTTIRFCVIGKNDHELDDRARLYHFRSSKVFASNPNYFTERLSGNKTRLSILSSVADELYSAYDGDIEQLSPEIAVQTFDLRLAELSSKATAAVVAIKPRLTIELLEQELETAGYTVRRNCISHELEARLAGSLLKKSDFVPTIHSDLGQRYTNVSMDILDSYLSVIANKNEYNPVLDYLRECEPDGRDHFPALYELMGIPESDWLSRSLIKKWMLQGIALLHNDSTTDEPTGAEGILVLQGRQGLKKTALLSAFSLKPSLWFLEGGEINEYDKDTTRRVLSVWIAELGEVEKTFKKSDAESMKNLITRKKDEYRLPYARYDENHPRRTNLAATCNSDVYLVDETGNRRYFTVPIERNIPYKEISAFDFRQLWKQVLHEYEAIPTQAERNACFRLDDAELDVLSFRNGERVKKLKAEQEIEDIFADVEERPNLYAKADLTISGWKNMWRRLDKYSSSEIGKVLKKLGIEFTRKNIGIIYKDLPIHKTTTNSKDSEN